ncbi:hypothetical protein EMCRGX_G004306 [Ephydatia muelleri]
MIVFIKLCHKVPVPKQVFQLEKSDLQKLLFDDQLDSKIISAYTELLQEAATKHMATYQSELKYPASVNLLDGILQCIFYSRISNSPRQNNSYDCGVFVQYVLQHDCKLKVKTAYAHNQSPFTRTFIRQVVKKGATNTTDFNWKAYITIHLQYQSIQKRKSILASRKML